MKPPSIWTPENVALLHRLFSQGMPLSEIAFKIDGAMTIDAVMKRTQRDIKSGILAARPRLKTRKEPDNLVRVRELAAAGQTNAEIARIVGDSKRHIDYLATTFTIRKPTEMWAEERAMKLKDMLSAGMGTTAIAKALGVGRNAIIGKAARLGLKLNGRKFDDRERTVKPKAAHKPRPIGERAKPQIPAEPGPAGDGITIMDLTTYSCRWPLGGSSVDTVFCGEPQDRDCPYCAKHRARAWSGQKMITGKRRHG